MAWQVCGIDWATEPRKRAAVILEGCGLEGAGNVVDIICPLSDQQTVELCTTPEFNVVAVDVPFGWPTAFCEFVVGWQVIGSPTQAVPDSERFQFRLTDLVVRQVVGKRPLSVSSNLIGLSARAWTKLVTDAGFSAQIDVGASQPTAAPVLIEVYPGATLAALFPRDGEIRTEEYKAEAGARGCVVDALTAMARIHCSEAHRGELVDAGKSCDTTDAFIAAISGACYLGQLEGWSVRRPADAEKAEAVREGWIFFPVRRE